jgi:ABC-type nickel/cobalt efflux system permease component RcnA
MLALAAVRRTVRAFSGPADVVIITHTHEHTHDEDHDHPHDLELVAPQGGRPVAGSTAPTVTATAHQHRHRHRHVATMPDDPFTTSAPRTAFAVGMVHGVGAETPTQILVFLAASRAGGVAVGILLLTCFLVGLVVSNTVVALTAAFGILGASRHFPLNATISVLAATFSVIIGTLFLIGQTPLLPAIAGG